MKMLLTPENSRPQLYYISNDEEIAAVSSDFGIVTGKNPGTCSILVWDQESGVRTEYTVIVLERTEPGDDQGSEPEEPSEEEPNQPEPSKK